MMKSKYILRNLIVFVVVLTAGCGEEPWSLADGGENLANLLAPSDEVYFYQATDVVSYDVDLVEAEGVSVNSIQVKKQLFTTEGNSDVSTFDITGSTISQTKSELFADVPVGGAVLTEDDLSPGDYWQFSYELLLSDGRVLEPGGQTKVTFTCPSEIGGDFTYSTINIIADSPNANPANCTEPVTGTGSLSEDGPGVYALSDATFGQYDCAWSDTPAVGVVWTDVCGTITVTGGDQYGLIYTFNIVSNNGTDLVLDWSNDYVDAGRTTLTRTSGSWPLNLSFD